MEKHDELNLLEIILILVLVIIAIPILLVLAIVFIPYYKYDYLKNRINRKKELKKKLLQNEGKITFLYKEHNQFDFNTYFKENNIEIECIKLSEYFYSDVFYYHTTKNFKSKGFPCLIAVINNEVVSKEHFNSFKHYVKRSKKPELFFELLKSSIKNLEKENNEFTNRNR